MYLFGIRFSASCAVRAVSVSLVMGSALTLAGAAAAVQASGSLAIIPQPSVVSAGGTVQETIRIRNTSSDTGSEGSGTVAATLLGTTRVNLACLDSACDKAGPGILAYASCSILDPGVCSCEIDEAAPGKGTVTVTMCAAGVMVAAGGSKNLVAINAVASPDAGTSKFFSSATSGPNDFRACSSTRPTTCATASSQASASLSLVP